VADLPPGWLNGDVIGRTETVRIARPTAEVWKLVGEPESWSLWAGEVTDVVVGGELGEGATASYTYRGRSVTAMITRYEPCRQLAIASSRPTYELRESIVLTEDGGSTGVSITMSFEPARWWGRALAVPARAVSGPLLGRALRRSLTSLKRAAEASTPRRPPPA
jgi:uncharacterized protein YndB with AHSA1/START domain